MNEEMPTAPQPPEPCSGESEQALTPTRLMAMLMKMKILKYVSPAFIRCCSYEKNDANIGPEMNFILI
jgi:hypothetical protein